MSKENRLGLNKLVYYNSTVRLIRILSGISIISLGGILILGGETEQLVDEHYVKSATVSFWICVIGSGLTYYILNSNFKKSIKMFGVEELNEPESVKRARLFGSTRFEFLSILISSAMLAIGLWFGLFFLIAGFLNV